MTDQATIDAGVPVVLAFSYQRICDLVTTAIETPVGDWFTKADATAELKQRAMTIAKARDDRGPWYAVPELYAQSDFQLTVTADNPESTNGKGRYILKTLTMEDFQRALILMATKDDGAYSRHFADFLRGNEDALTADLFMQFAVYGEEVFS